MESAYRRRESDGEGVGKGEIKFIKKDKIRFSVSNYQKFKSIHIFYPNPNPNPNQLFSDFHIFNGRDQTRSIKRNDPNSKPSREKKIPGKFKFLFKLLISDSNREEIRSGSCFD